MYGSPLYMTEYGAPAVPTLPSGKKYPLLERGDTDSSVKSSSGISDLVSWTAHALHDELNGLNPNKSSRDAAVLINDNPLFTDPKVTSKLSSGQQQELVAFITEYNPNAGGKMTTFGTKLDAAVRAFQAYKGLSVDGKVGKKTWSALGYTGVNNKTGSTASVSTSKTPAPVAPQGFDIKRHWSLHQDKYYIGGIVFTVAGALYLALRK